MDSQTVSSFIASKWRVIINACGRLYCSTAPRSETESARSVGRRATRRCYETLIEYGNSANKFYRTVLSSQYSRVRTAESVHRRAAGGGARTAAPVAALAPQSTRGLADH